MGANIAKKDNLFRDINAYSSPMSVSYTHLRAHET